MNVTRLGYVADYCTICLKPRAHALEQLALTAEEAPEYRRVCERCTVAAHTERERYASVLDTPCEIHELQFKTLPDLEQAHAARLALEQQVSADPMALPTDLRHQLLLEPFVLLSAHLGQQAAPDRAYVGSYVLPQLRRTIARLRPMRQELVDLLQELSGRGEPLALYVNVDDLLEPPGADGVAPTSPGAAASPSVPAAKAASGLPDKAAMVFKVLGWLGLGSLAIVGLIAMLDGYNGISWMPFAIALALLAALMLGLASGIRRRAGWTRVVGILVAALMLAGFPIGTIIGAYIIYCLALHWDVPAAAAPSAEL